MPDQTSLLSCAEDAMEKGDISQTSTLPSSSIGSRPAEAHLQHQHQPGSNNATNIHHPSLAHSHAELTLGPKIIGVPEQKVPQKFLRLLNIAWRKFTAASVSPSSEFGLSAEDSETTGVSSPLYAAGQDPFDRDLNNDRGLDVVVEDSTFDLPGSSDCGETTAKAGSQQDQQQQQQQKQNTAGSGTRSAHVSDLGNISSVPSYLSVLSRLRWGVQHFFVSCFADRKQEAIFQREWWAQRKGLAIAFSLFVVLNWILYLTLNEDLDSLFSRITFFGVATAFTVPLPFIIAWDVPTRYPIFFQLYFACAVWIWGLTEVVQSKVCGYWPDSQPCNGKNFSQMVFYLTAWPTLGLFVCSNRLMATLFAILGFVLINVFIIPFAGPFSRVLTSYTLYHAFIIACHWVHECRERRMFRLNLQLKIAYRAQQRAQVKEDEAAASKRRFVSYIFHEVRVPLNTALLSFQTLQADEAFKKNSDTELELHALEGSLAMMGKVLNDVLDLHRMDAGRFETSEKPFPLHRSITSTLGGLRVATAAKDIRLNVHLDPAVDAVQQSPLGENLLSGLWLKGDDMRLRQILMNLASNACKFTPKQGTISLTTKLLQVQTSAAAPSSSFTDDSKGFKAALKRADLEKGGALPSEPRKRLVVRFEVSDTGAGIGLSDMQSQTLFTPFVQTSTGKALGGKGSGLGLAIVRQIVKLSGGRVGVTSKVGEGSTFWFELAFWTATRDEIAQTGDNNVHSSDWRKALDVEATRAACGNNSSAASPPSEAGVANKLLRPALDRLTSFDTSMRATLPHLVEHPEDASSASIRPPMESPTIETKLALKVHPAESSLSSGSSSYLPQPSACLSDASSSRPLLHKSASSVVPPPAASAGDSKNSSPSGSSSGLDKTPTEESPESALSSSSLAPPVPSTPPDNIKLPPSNASAPPAQSTSPLPIPEPRNLKILVVDDDGLTRKLMSRMLQRQGCTISTAEDGQHALDLLLGDGAQFDCIFLDNQMPCKTGLNVVTELRAAQRHDLVVGVTGNALREDQDGYLAAGADFVLIKPVMAGDLTRMLDFARSRLSSAGECVD